MTRAQAHRILNAARDGQAVSMAAITHALRTTGDMPVSPVAALAMAKRRAVVCAGAESVMAEVRAGRNVDPHRVQWAFDVLSTREVFA
ncbi:MAG: hypothetical protein ACRCV9_19550 [Burkholderiaceae bacterium]